VTATTASAGVPGDRGHPYYRRAEARLLAEFSSTGQGGRNAALNATTYKLARIALACGVPPARAGAVMTRAAQAAGLGTDPNCRAGGIGSTVSSALCAAVRDGGWPIRSGRGTRT
jgi:predicted GNAT family acetyltransferase